MKELTPEELFDQVAQKRAEQDADGDLPITASIATTATNVSSEDEEEGGVIGDDDTKHQEQPQQQQQALDEDLLLRVKEADALASPTRRNPSHSSPGAFGVAPYYPSGLGGGASSVTTTAHRPFYDGTRTTDEPPIRAILVVDNSDEETAANSIYTAEPLGSILLKDPFYRKKWQMVIVGLCALGMLGIIAGSVAAAVYVSNDGSGPNDSPESIKTSRPQDQSSASSFLGDGGGRGTYRDDDDDDDDTNHDRLHFTHHALIFGTSAQDCFLSHDTKLNVTVSCNDSAEIDLRHLSSDAIQCRTVDTHSIVCDMPLRNETIEFLSYDCFGNQPPKRDELVTTVDLHVPSLLDCLVGDSAFARLVRFCDEFPYISRSGTVCPSAELMSTPMDFLGACQMACSDGCDFQALDYSTCRPGRIGQNIAQVLNITDAIRLRMVHELFSS